MNSSVRFLTTGVVTLACCVLIACGGGGDNSAGPLAAPPTPPPVAQVPQVGTVGVVLTDAPAFDFDEVLATISSIELLGDEDPVTLFAGEQTIDLLRLSSFTELFAVSDEVPVGDYSKIRLRLTELTLVRNDANGNVADTIAVNLPGNGKVDLNPRQTFSVTPGSTLLIELDVDANKSIKITGQGNEMRYRFRPVVFVKVYADGGEDRLARVHGVVDGLLADPAGFVLCQTDFVADPDRDDMDAHNESRCVTVELDADTGIFDASGEPAGTGQIEVGEALTVIGNLRGAGVHDDNDDGYADNLVLSAYVVELGPLGTFERVAGRVASAPVIDRFGLEIAAGQGFGAGTTITALLQNGTRLFDRDGAALDSSTALSVDTDGHFEGVLMLSDIAADELKTALIVLDTDVTSRVTVSGTVQSVDVALRNLILSTDVGDRCVLVVPEATITRVALTDDGTISETIGLDELPSGVEADVFGDEDAGGCFIAQSIRI